MIKNSLVTNDFCLVAFLFMLQQKSASAPPPININDIIIIIIDVLKCIGKSHVSVYNAASVQNTVRQMLYIKDGFRTSYSLFIKEKIASKNNTAIKRYIKLFSAPKYGWK